MATILDEIKYLFSPGDRPVPMSTVQPLIDQLPPLAKQDILDDLQCCAPDQDLVEALEITLAAHKRTGLDGEALYDVVQTDVDAKYGAKR